MSSTMAKKKKPLKPEEGREGVFRQSFYFPEELIEALEEYVDCTTPRPTKTSAVIAILSDFLRERGHLSKKGKETDR